ncbi:serine hydrolase [Streptomyces sp. HNM0574]|uniref:D-alanyl-D-alanine carboxypeptidase family protein n=1 Tax=Streptomyces sp. HNM0574 TaxID=2714954 RepID=UPI001F0F4F48|nr:serine hydrolase [Streptomyces sp. HNM0574]
MPHPRRRTAAATVVTGAVLAAGPLVTPAQAARTPTTDRAPGTAQQAPAAAGPSGIKAKSAFVLNDDAGKRMWSKDADTPREMASTTKVMTAAVVVSTKGVDLDRKITVKQAYRDYVARNGASTADLKTGDKLSARQLLYALMLPSGCDAAYALADTFGEGRTNAERTASFIAKMNAKARQLGMKNTRFDTFDGISRSGGNRSTARDMTTLAHYALGSKNIRKVVGAQKAVQKATNGRTYTWYNTNKMLATYQGMIGIKTGTGTKAGACLVFAATRNGHTVSGTLLNSAARTSDATKVLNWAFSRV